MKILFLVASISVNEKFLGSISHSVIFMCMKYFDGTVLLPNRVEANSRQPHVIFHSENLLFTPAFT
jgi:hypothetical protein